jgi:hypothetical protein
MRCSDSAFERSKKQRNYTHYSDAVFDVSRADFSKNSKENESYISSLSYQ